MYTVLLVDDENTVIDTLLSAIPWQLFGIESVLTAADGVQALKLMSDYPVNLLITDIQMPKMNGLELLSQVRPLYPDTHCILLTAHGEFEYAKQAIKLGVENYLLKPFNQNELEETIERAFNNIHVDQENAETLFRTNILMRWINGTISNDELCERSNLLDINLFLPSYIVVCIKKKKPSIPWQPFYMDVLQELSGKYESHTLWDHRGYQVFIIGGKNLSSQDIMQIFTVNANKFGIIQNFAISIGSQVSAYMDVPQSYQSAYLQLEAADMTIEGTIILEVDPLSRQENEIILQDILVLFSTLEDYSDRKIIYNDLIIRMLNSNPSYEKTFLQLTQSVLQVFIQKFPNDFAIKEQIISRIRMLPHIKNEEDFTAHATAFMDFSYIQFQYAFDKFSSIIQRSIAYIHQNYTDSLSIKEFCVKAKVSVSYFGYLFKKETSMFFNNYLEQYRVCRAIQLLRDTDLKIQDIAMRVGFSSPSYFNSRFKNLTGLSPVKYRSFAGL